MKRRLPWRKDLDSSSPKVYGCLCSNWQGALVSVLVMERVYWDFYDFLSYWFRFTPCESLIQGLTLVIRSFFLLMREATTERNLCVRDMTWELSLIHI